MNRTLFRRIARLIMVIGVVLSLMLAGGAPSGFGNSIVDTAQVGK